jgi:hypothetical protein
MDKAFEILVVQYRHMLVTYASALLYGDLHLAEDVVQESYLLAHQRLNTFRMGENFGAWLRAIVRRKAMEAQRASGKTRVVTDSRVIEGIEQVFGVFDSSTLDEESYGERMRRWTRHCVDLLAKLLLAGGNPLDVLGSLAGRIGCRNIDCFVCGQHGRWLMIVRRRGMRTVTPGYALNTLGGGSKLCIPRPRTPIG